MNNFQQESIKFKGELDETNMRHQTQQIEEQLESMCDKNVQTEGKMFVDENETEIDIETDERAAKRRKLFVNFLKAYIPNAILIQIRRRTLFFHRFYHPCRSSSSNKF